MVYQTSGFSNSNLTYLSICSCCECLSSLSHLLLETSGFKHLLYLGRIPFTTLPFNSSDLTHESFLCSSNHNCICSAPLQHVASIIFELVFQFLPPTHPLPQQSLAEASRDANKGRDSSRFQLSVYIDF